MPGLGSSNNDNRHHFLVMVPNRSAMSSEYIPSCREDIITATNASTTLECLTIITGVLGLQLRQSWRRIALIDNHTDHWRHHLEDIIRDRPDHKSEQDATTPSYSSIALVVDKRICSNMFVNQGIFQQWWNCYRL